MATTRMDSAVLSRLLQSWTDEASALPEALAAAMIGLVDDGLVPPGITLPPQRELAAVLGVSRGTVAAAYVALGERGYLIAQQGSGTRVRSGRVASKHVGEGRFFSFTNAPAEVIDLSTGALPASAVARRVLASGPPPDLAHYLSTDGYFPAGLPVLRQAIAEQLTRDGLPTVPQQVLVTAGGQQATSLAVRHLISSGDLALVEDPTFRGAIEALRAFGAHVEAVPLRRGVMDVELLRRAATRRPAMIYCQTGVHNPVGSTAAMPARRELAAVLNVIGAPVVEDCCSYDLTRRGGPARTLVGLVDPELLISMGTLSKLFWGGLRVGWMRAAESRVRAVVELRKAADLATSVVDQLYGVAMLRHVDDARAERRGQLGRQLAATEQVVRRFFPGWTWSSPAGGTGLWIDTHADAQALAERAKRVGVKLVAGPSFSAHEGQRTMLRLPVWHEPEQLAQALGRLG
ncbi:PLP-dependent aminotransferase family protein [Propionibacteriaceae bacterium G1746]|uniref:aminotransferase-like domain-containing protein n=1 Tax=Aestuariimicrobium sp. G57 TaxID=3418485 RepID=UPI003C278E58